MMAALSVRFFPLVFSLWCAGSLRQPLVKDVGILYGIETCGDESYEAMLQAELDTWARNLSRESLIIVAGSKDDFYSGHAASLPDCPEEIEGVACKEGVMLDRAIDRARLLDAQWLVVGQDDKYIWTKALEDALQDFNSSVPQVFSSMGCGQAWEYHPESADGTKPMPPHFIQPLFSCQGVWEHGGMCGGPTYIVSRGALELLRRPGQSSQAFHDEFLSLNKNWRASDLTASCLFRERGIAMRQASQVSLWLEEIGKTSSPASDSHEAMAAAARRVMTRLGHSPLTLHIALDKSVVPGFIHALSDFSADSSAQQGFFLGRTLVRPHSFD